MPGGLGSTFKVMIFGKGVGSPGAARRFLRRAGNIARPMALEREIKLQFRGASEARAAVLTTGATPRGPRRLQQDSLLDTADGLLRGRGCALRVRQEPGQAILTFKGPVEPSVREAP